MCVMCVIYFVQGECSTKVVPVFKLAFRLVSMVLCKNGTVTIRLP